MNFPPVASSVLNSAWNNEQYSSFAPSGAIYNSWKNHRNTDRSVYLANTLNHYEDLGSRNRFNTASVTSNAQPAESTFVAGGEVPWLVGKFLNNSSSLRTSSGYYQHDKSPYKFYHRLNLVTFDAKTGRAAVFPVGPILNSTGLFPYIPFSSYTRTIYSIEYNRSTNRYRRRQTRASAAVSIFRLQFELNNSTSRQVYIAFDGNNQKIENRQKSSYLGTPTLNLNALSSNYLSAVNTTLLIIFREYCHYVGNALGGTGLIDLTPFTINATTYVERNLKTDIYSAYGTSGMSSLIDYENQVAPVRLWPTGLLSGLP